MPVDLLSQKILINGYLKESSSHLSSFSFLNIFAWQDFFEFELKLINGNLCVFAQDALGCFLYLPPLGKPPQVETIDACFEFMEDANKGRGVTRVENVDEAMRALFPEERFNFYRKGYEYGYYKKDRILLKGNAFKAERALYNHCLKNYHCRYQPFDSGMTQECIALYEDWAAARRERIVMERTKEAQGDFSDGIYLQMLEENRRVHERTMRHYQDLDLVGRVVVVDGRIKAYTFGYPVNEKIFCDFLEIADLNIKGLSVFIFREFCKDEALAGYDFINAMDDLGLINIGRTKMSLRPAVLWSSYCVTKR